VFVLAALLGWMVFLGILAVRVIRDNPEHSDPEPLRRVSDLAEPPALVEVGWSDRGFAPLGQYAVGAEEAGAYISAWLSSDSTMFALLCEARDELGIESRFRWIELISASASGEYVRTSTLHDLPGHSHCGGPEATRLNRAGPDATLEAHRAKVAQRLGAPVKLTAEQLPEVSRQSSVAAHPEHAEAHRSWQSSWEMFRHLVMPWALRRNLWRTLLMIAVTAAALAWMRTNPSHPMALVAGFGMGVLLGSFATRPASAWVVPVGVGLLVTRPDQSGLLLGTVWCAAVAITQLRVRRSATAPFPERQRQAGPSLAPA
jgi:hypothetical protein